MTNSEEKFPCTSCGVCCRVLPKRVHGWPLRADGACFYLNSDNQCDIYEDRPEVCKVGYFATDKARYYEATAELCNKMQEEAGVGEEYRVVYVRQDDQKSG